MKKLAIIFGVLFCCVPVAFCEEIPQQVIEIESSGAVAIFQKQPITDKQQQIIKIKKSGGFLLVQINGKVKDTGNNSTAQ